MAGRRKKKRATFGDIMRTLLMLISLVVFIFSGYTLYGYYKEYQKSSQEYDNLEAQFFIEEEEEESEKLEALGSDDLVFDELEDDEVIQNQSFSGKEMVAIWENGKEVTVPTMKNPIDFEELGKVNEDIIGWLRIRALDISYPIVQGEDNDYYLHRTFEGVENIAGCIFANCDNSSDFTDQNTLIYGHNMKNGSMFGKLKNFQEEETFNKSKFFWVFTEDLIYQYRIFSAMTVDKVGINYQTFFAEAEEFPKFKEQAFQNSVVKNSEVSLSYDDRIVTLSTCTGNDATRFVVMGKLVQIYKTK